MNKVTSGVPQGSVLGPVLFLIYINTLDLYVKDFSDIISKFADDSKVGKIIRDQSDNLRLQSAIDELCKWATDWQMQFNATKCSVMHFGHRNPEYNYTMYDNPLMATDKEKDVGVIISKNLKPNNHVLKAASTANRVLGLISRSIHFRDKKVWIDMYKTYVRPHLEYAVQCWSPWSNADIRSLEKVQERVINMCSCLKGNNYEEKLREVKLMSLEDRRTRADMILTWKILNKKIDVDETTWFTRLNANNTRETRLTHSGLNLSVPRTSLEIRRNFFSARVPNTWNQLPEKVKVATSVSSFKHLYDHWHEQRQPREF